MSYGTYTLSKSRLTDKDKEGRHFARVVMERIFHVTCPDCSPRHIGTAATEDKAREIAIRHGAIHAAKSLDPMLAENIKNAVREGLEAANAKQ